MNAKSKEFIDSLPENAWEFINECLGNTKQKLSNSGKIVDIGDRKIPTIGYFLRIWLPLNNKETFHRATWYRWLSSDDNVKCDTIKEIDALFNELATDIVANEGKGIFYAKNKLGMTDKVEQNVNVEQPMFGKDINE